MLMILRQVGCQLATTARVSAADKDLLHHFPQIIVTLWCNFQEDGIFAFAGTSTFDCLKTLAADQVLAKTTVKWIND